MRRLEGQDLVVLRKLGFELAEPHSAAGRDHQLGRLVRDDPRVAARIQHFAEERVTVEVLGPAAAQSNWFSPGCGGPDAVLEFHQTQKRGSSGCGSCPPCTRMRPYSAQRASVGTALPGFSSP